MYTSALTFFVVVGNIIVGLLSIDRIDVASQLASCFFLCVCGGRVLIKIMYLLITKYAQKV